MKLSIPHLAVRSRAPLSAHPDVNVLYIIIGAGDD